MINLAPGTKILGKYKIKRKLTQGGMDSDIYLAENINYSKDTYIDNKFKYAAIKLIKKGKDTSNDQWEKILDEGTTTGRLSTKKNIIKLYDFLKFDDETIIIAMEYINGYTLSKYILDNGWLSPIEAIRIFREILIAVKQLHENNKMIIHRDLKPDNILLSKDLTKIRLIDFGISSVIEKSTIKNDYEILTNEESFYGTIPYLSPDILKFKGKKQDSFGSLITKQFDFYSLGIIFYEMLTGNKPYIYENEDDPASIKIPLKYDIPPLKNVNSEIPNDIENMIIKMISSNEKYKKFRYSDIDEIMTDLDKCEMIIKKKMKESDLLIPIDKRNLQNLDQKIKKTINKNTILSKVLFYSILSITLMIFIILIIIFPLKIGGKI